MHDRLEPAAALWLVPTVLILAYSRAWLLRALAPTSSWSQAVLASLAMNAVDFVLAMLLPTAALRIACAVPIHTAIVLSVYRSSLEDTFLVATALRLTLLSIVLHALIAVATVSLFLLIQLAVLSGTGAGLALIVASASMVGFRRWGAWRARMLARRMQEVPSSALPTVVVRSLATEAVNDTLSERTAASA